MTWEDKQENGSIKMKKEKEMKKGGKKERKRIVRK
jgi:hypothetical protein